MNLAGLVVFYNPNGRYLANVEKYIAAVDKLYIVDNSENDFQWVYSSLLQMYSGKIEVIENWGNSGIARALNLGAEKAWMDGFRYLLTMDQDSFFEIDELYRFKEHIQSEKEDNIAIYAPRLNLEKPETRKAYNEVITSGSILKLDIWGKIEGFREDFFIYVVDIEYCWKVRRNGYFIRKYPDIVLQHQTNDYCSHNGKKEYCRNTSGSTFYYVVRNNLYLISEYIHIFPIWSLKRFIRMTRTWGRIYFKEKNKKIKRKYIRLAIADFLRGVKGKCPDVQRIRRA